jgi:DNA-binding NtrC family response regulator
MIAVVIAMKILVFSNDIDLITVLTKVGDKTDNRFTFFDKLNDPLDVMSTVCSKKPNVLIIDDDYLKPKTAHILKSIRKVNKDLKIIFITSDSSIELGSEISQLGIYFYAIKPLDELELLESIQSIFNLKTKKNY